MYIFTKKIFKKIISVFPIVILFFFAFTGFDFSFFFFDINFSFNLIYIVIFYWILKNPDHLGYGFIFFAGLINDVVQNFPIGISSINYLLLCAIAIFIRARTLLPNILYDWVLFFVGIIIITSENFSIITLIFEFPINYGTSMFNSFITFLVYPIFSKIFDEINKFNIRQEDAE